MRRLRTSNDIRALLLSILNMTLNLVDRGLVDERAVRDALVEPVANLELANLGSKLGRKFVVHACLHQETIGADAGLLSEVRLSYGDQVGITRTCPDVRNLHAIAPSTAASRSASSKTNNGKAVSQPGTEQSWTASLTDERRVTTELHR